MDILFKPDRIFSQRWIKDYLLIILGSFVVASSYVFFISPFKIIPGGVYGLSIIIHYLTKEVFSFFPDGFPIGTMALVFNIPLAYASYKLLGKSSVLKTITTFFLTAVFVDLLSFWFGIKPIVPGDILLASLYGGVVLGIGVALIFKARSTSAGTDVVSKIIARMFNMQVGLTIIVVDSIIVLIGLLVFGDWKIPFYSWITIFVYGKVVDVIMQGISSDKAVFIISDMNEEISQRIIHDVKRGATFIHGKGVYNKQEKDIILTTVGNREVTALQDYIKSIDPAAFMITIDATEIVGKGFKSFEAVEK